MSIFMIKIIAYVTMFIDHIKYAIPETENFITLYFGRIAFPLFAFLLTEGYVHTKNLDKYYKRLLIFALISQIPFMLFRSLLGSIEKLNIMFTLAFGLIAINAYDKIKNKYITISLGIVIAILGVLLNVDYGWYGIILIMILYIFKTKKVLLSFVFIILNIVYEFSRYKFHFEYMDISVLYRIIFMNIPLIFIWLYNGKLGKKLNYISYLFYPVHLLILYLINIFFVV